jgi:DNA polymerase-4
VSDGVPSPQAKRLLLVDCDCFFVQVARLEDPEGAGRAPLLIVGGSASGRGVVTSASYEAREFGVRSAMPTGQALRLCPDATVVGVPRGACGRKSREIEEVLERLSPVVQAASIDEFYLDLTGTERLLRGEALEETARRIRRSVLDETEISVSIGGGTNRTVAKLATRRAKPGGVFTVPPGGEADFLREHRLGDLPGVGPSFLKTLERKGLVSVEDALSVQKEWLERWLGPSRGGWLYDRIRGRDSRPVHGRDPRKSISSERTFPEDLDDDDELEARLLRIATGVARTLRSKGLRARTVTVKIRDGDFTTRQAGHTLPEPVESDPAIAGAARALLEELRSRRRAGVRLLGVALSGLVDVDAPTQLALFEETGRAETERDRTVSRLMDDVRGRFGDDALRPGRMFEEEE